MAKRIIPFSPGTRVLHNQYGIGYCVLPDKHDKNPGMNKVRFKAGNQLLWIKKSDLTRLEHES